MINFTICILADQFQGSKGSTKVDIITILNNGSITVTYLNIMERDISSLTTKTKKDHDPCVSGSQLQFKDLAM